MYRFSHSAWALWVWALWVWPPGSSSDILTHGKLFRKTFCWSSRFVGAGRRAQQKRGEFPFTRMNFLIFILERKIYERRLHSPCIGKITSIYRVHTSNANTSIIEKKVHWENHDCSAQMICDHIHLQMKAGFVLHQDDCPAWIGIAMTTHIKCERTFERRMRSSCIGKVMAHPHEIQTHPGPGRRRKIP